MDKDLAPFFKWQREFHRSHHRSLPWLIRFIAKHKAWAISSRGERKHITIFNPQWWWLEYHDSR